MSTSVVGVAHPQVTVSWSCRRCGHTGGVARTTVPVPTEWTEAMGRTMFDGLRRKLVRVHQRHSVNTGRPCVPAPGDFVFGPYVPPGKRQEGVL